MAGCDPLRALAHDATSARFQFPKPAHRAPKFARAGRSWPVSSSITCKVSPRPIRATGRSWRTSICQFYPDAKIGVLGVNGSGKSTLLRIMAGIDTEYNGEAWVAEGARVGYLQQEPQLDPEQVGARERDGGRRAAEGDPRPLQRARRQLFGRDRRRDDQAAGRDRGQGPVGSRFQGRPGDGRAALPARRRRREQALRRRAPPRRALPAAAGATRTAPARRADQPSRRRVRALAGRPSAQLSGRDPDRHPRPLLPRQRHRLDSRARPRPRHSLRGQLHRLAGAEAEAARAGRPRGGRAPAHARPRAGMDRVVAARPAGEVQGALQRL